jgi:hypothetical protein
MSAPDLTQARRHIELLTGNPDAAVTFQVFDDSPAKDSSRAKVYHGTLADFAPALKAKSAAGCGVFVTVNETDGQGRKAENIIRVRALFVDIDDAEEPAWQLPPSFICRRDPRHLHAYWLVSDGDLAAFAGDQSALIAFYGSDPKPKDLPRVLRLAGFAHQKDPAKPVPYTLSDGSGRTYTRAEILAAHQDPEDLFNSPDPAPVPMDPGAFAAFMDSAQAEPVAAPLPAQPAADDLKARALARLMTVHSVQGNDGSAGLVRAVRLIQSGFGLTGDDGKVLLGKWNAACAHPMWSANEMRHAWGRLLKSPPTKPDTWREMASKGDAAGDFDGEDTATAAELGKGAQPASKVLRLEWFVTVEEKKPDWIWRDHLPKGCTVVLGGRQGGGKGLVTCDIAARITRGDAMPDGMPGTGQPGRVLFVTREDDPAIALKPRLRVAGADMSRVAFTHGDFTDGTPIETMADAAVLIAAEIKRHGFDLVFVDPLGAWVEDDANNGQQIRAVVDPMNRVARETGACICFVAHLRKAPADDPMDAFSGSAQVTAAVRVALLLAAVSDSDRMLSVAKTNFRKPGGPVVFRPVMGSMDPEDPPRLEWRLAGQDDRIAAQATRGGTVQVIPLDKVLPLVPEAHKPFDEVARLAHKALLPDHHRLPLQSVKDAMLGLVEAGQAYEGQGAKGRRTIGRGPAPAADDALDRAVAAWEASPTATVREIAKAAGVSVERAHKARSIARSVVSVRCSEGEAPNAEQSTEHNAAVVCSVPLSPIGGEGHRTNKHSGTEDTPPLAEEGGAA